MSQGSSASMTDRPLFGRPRWLACRIALTPANPTLPHHSTMMRRSLLWLLVLLPCTVAASPFSAGPWGVSPRRVSGDNNHHDRSRRSRRSPSASTMTAAISSAVSSPHDLARSSNNPDMNRLRKAVLAGRRGKRTKQSAVVEQQADVLDSPTYDDGQQRFAGPNGEELTLEEMRARLGPVGKTVAGAVEVGMVTAGSFLSGGILGYIGGGLFGLGALARPSDYQPPPPPNLPGQQPPPTPPTRPKPTGFGGEFRGRMGNVNAKAVASAKSWAQLSAAFSGHLKHHQGFNHKSNDQHAGCAQCGQRIETE